MRALYISTFAALFPLLGCQATTSAAAPVAAPLSIAIVPTAALRDDTNAAGASGLISSGSAAESPATSVASAGSAEGAGAPMPPGDATAPETMGRNANEGSATELVLEVPATDERSAAVTSLPERGSGETSERDGATATSVAPKSEESAPSQARSPALSQAPSPAPSPVPSDLGESGLVLELNVGP